METYTALRGFADSWGLLALFLVFIGIIAWVFRPGARARHDDAARMIFRNEDKPKDDDTPGPANLEPTTPKDDADGR